MGLTLEFSSICLFFAVYSASHITQFCLICHDNRFNPDQPSRKLRKVDKKDPSHLRNKGKRGISGEIQEQVKKERKMLVEALEDQVMGILVKGEEAALMLVGVVQLSFHQCLETTPKYPKFMCKQKKYQHCWYQCSKFYLSFRPRQKNMCRITKNNSLVVQRTTRDVQPRVTFATSK